MKIDNVGFIQIDSGEETNKAAMKNLKNSKLQISCQNPLLSKGKGRGRYDLQIVNFCASKNAQKIADTCSLNKDYFTSDEELVGSSLSSYGCFGAVSRINYDVITQGEDLFSNIAD